jgi:O-acetyl-ADP-ribose deacetylase (regulator of RNase III)
MRKINHQYPRKKIGLPKIGCGLAGGDWNIVRQIIERELIDMDVTIVNFNHNKF